MKSTNSENRIYTRGKGSKHSTALPLIGLFGLLLTPQMFAVEVDFLAGPVLCPGGVGRVTLGNTSRTSPCESCWTLFPCDYIFNFALDLSPGVDYELKVEALDGLAMYLAYCTATPTGCYVGVN